jgi:hypothetical protein
MITVKSPLRISRRLPLQSFLLLFIALVQIVMLIRLGPFHSPDTTTYNNWADALIVQNFNLIDFFTATKDWVGGANKLYLNHIFLVSFLRLGFGESWGYALIAINIFCQTATAYLLLKIVRLVTGSIFLSLLSLGIYCLAFDAFTWSRYLLSESVFLFLNFLVFFYLIKCFIVPVQRTSWDLAMLWTTCLFTAFYRPHGLITLLSVIVISLNPNFLRKYSAKIVLAIFFAGIIGVFFSHAFVLLNYHTWKSFPLYSWIDFNAGFYRLGVIVHSRPETYLPEPTSYLSYVKITFVRFIQFFNFFPSGWSLAHRMLSSIFFLPVYLFMSKSIWRIINDDMPKERVVICLLALAYILGIAGLSAVSILDFDWRYRVSLYPFFVLVAVLGNFLDKGEKFICHPS